MRARLAAGPAGSGSSGQHGAGAEGAGGGEGTGLARRRRRAADRGNTVTVWSVLSQNLDGGDLTEVGRWLGATARKGGTHGGAGKANLRSLSSRRD